MQVIQGGKFWIIPYDTSGVKVWERSNEVVDAWNAAEKNGNQRNRIAKQKYVNRKAIEGCTEKKPARYLLEELSPFFIPRSMTDNNIPVIKIYIKYESIK